MKAKRERIILPLVIFLVGSIFIYLLDGDLYHTLVIIGFMVICAIIARLWMGNYIPSDTVFQNKHWIQAAGFFLFILLFLNIQNVFEEGIFNLTRFIISVVVAIVTSFIMGIIFKKSDKNIEIPDAKELEENEKISISARGSYIEGEIEMPGTVTLSNQNIYFISRKDAFVQKFDIRQGIILKKWMKLPLGIEMEGGKEIRMSYPKYWMQKIKDSAYWVAKSVS